MKYYRDKDNDIWKVLPDNKFYVFNTTKKKWYAVTDFSSMHMCDDMVEYWDLKLITKAQAYIEIL